MLRKRLVTVLTVNDGILYRTKTFHPDYPYTLNFVDSWEIDEIVVLDITRPGADAPNPFAPVLTELARSCFVPLSAGGGVRRLDDVRRLLDLGADKIVFNTAMADRPGVIEETASLYGSQSVVLSIDARRGPGGGYQTFTQFGSRDMGVAPDQWARLGQQLGAGEILVTSIDRDGSLSGYDLDLCQAVVSAVTIPVLICGGAGNWQHFLDGFVRGGASAVCTTNIFHFTDTSIRSAKQFLSKAGLEVRL